MKYTYQLQPYAGPGSRYTCPQCGRKGRFVRYVNTGNGQPLAPHVGRCSRQVKCGYHFTPKQHFAQIPQTTTAWPRPMPTAVPLPAVSYTPLSTMQQTLHNYHQNHLAVYLYGVLGHALTLQLVAQYCLGTGTKWPGATVFWQIDCRNRIRGGKVILYNPHTGKRVKQPYNHISWVHAGTGYHLQQCLFGEHLLHQYPHKEVALVESEKTALVATAYMPQYLWLAVGSLSQLTPQKCAVLQGREVTLYPDLNGYQLWCQKAAALQQYATITVSDYLQRVATDAEKNAGYDLADYLLTRPLQQFAQAQPLHATPPTEYTLADMQHYFAQLTGLPQGTVQLKPYLSVTNLPQQIDNWLQCCQLYQGKKIYNMYFNHLLQIRQWVEAGMPQAEPAKPFTLKISR